MKKGKDKKKRKDKKQAKGKIQAVKRSPKALKKEIKQLRREIQERDELIRELNRRQMQESASSIDSDPSPAELPESRRRGVALAQRKAWERHQFLRSRYEFHLESGAEKGPARAMADADLRGRYGDEAGYTPEQLDAILS